MSKTTEIRIQAKDNAKSICIEYPYLTLLVGLILLHLFCITRVGLAQVLALSEAAIVLFFLLQKKVHLAVLLFGVFTLTSYDNNFFFAEPVGVKDVYSVSLLPIVSTYFYVFLSFVLFVISILRVFKSKIKFNNLLVKFAIYTLIVMIPMGIVSFITDGASTLAISRDIKNNVIPALWVLSFFVLFYSRKSFIYKYEKLIIHILLAYIIAALITSSLGFFLERGNRLTILYLPLASFFYTSIILFLYEIPRKTDKILIGVMFGFSVFFQLFFDNCLGGKSWFVFVTVFVVELYYIFRRIALKNIMIKLTTLLIVLLTIGVLSSKVASYINDTDNGKLLEFVSLFEGAQSGDLDDVGDSAQFRFLEFITITDYYRNHPLFLFFGKGIGGGVPNAGFFVYSETAFTDDQYKNNSFSVMHESFNHIYMKCGLIGLLFFIVVLISGFKRIKYDPLFYIGIVWMFFYWAYSVNLLFIGLPAFVIAYQKLDNNKKNEKNISL